MTLNGTLGPVSEKWASDRIDLGTPWRLKAPVTLSDTTLTWAIDGEKTFLGDMTTGGGTKLSMDLKMEGTNLRHQALVVGDEHQQVRARGRVAARLGSGCGAGEGIGEQEGGQQQNQDRLKQLAEEQERVQKKVEELKKAAEGDDAARIKQLSEEVQQAFHALSQQLYAQGQPQPEAEGGPSAPPPGEGSAEGDVIDGEVTDA